MVPVPALPPSVSQPAPVPVIRVPPDRFETTLHDAVLAATLDDTLALCFYDAVEEPGALLHLRVVPPGAGPRADTAIMRSADLVLLEQCTDRLHSLAPAARHWQCKLAAQIPDHDSVLAVAMASIIDFVSDYLRDSSVKLVDTRLRFTGKAELMFRPAMGELKIVQ